MQMIHPPSYYSSCLTVPRDCTLYKNVLWSNWMSLATDCRAIYILGNSLRTYIERSSEERDSSVPEKDRPTSCLERVQPTSATIRIRNSY